MFPKNDSITRVQIDGHMANVVYPGLSEQLAFLQALWSLPGPGPKLGWLSLGLLHIPGSGIQAEGTAMTWVCSSPKGSSEPKS